MKALISRNRIGQLLGALLLLACLTYPSAAWAPTSIPVGLSGPTLPLQGQATYTVAVAPPAGSMVTVKLQDSPAGADQWSAPFDTYTVDTNDPASTSAACTESGTSGDYVCSGPALDTTALGGDGNYDIRAVATDSADNLTGSSILTDQTVANNSAYIAMLNPGSPLSGTASLVADVQGGGDTPDTVTFEICPMSDDCENNPAKKWTELAPTGPDAANDGKYTAALDTTKFADGSYEVSVTGEDSANDAFQGGLVSDVEIDNTAPTVSLENPGGAVSGITTLTADAGDSGSGISSVQFQVTPSGTGQWETVGAATASPYEFRLDTRQFSDGSYDLRAIATDVAGNQTTSAVVPGVSISNPAGSSFGGLTVTDVDVPATNVTLLGELPGAEHETWAIGETNAPPPIVNGTTLPYTAEGNGQVVVLEYTQDTGWQIVDVLRNPDGSAYQLHPGAQTTVTGAMASNGEAWVVVRQGPSGGTPYWTELFHRQASGGSFQADDGDTCTLTGGSWSGSTCTAGGPGVLTGSFSLRLGYDQGSGQVYGAVFPASNSTGAQDQTVFTPQGVANVPVQLQYGQLVNNNWTLPQATLPTTIPSGVTKIALDGGAVTGPGAGWGTIEIDTNGLGGVESNMVLGQFSGSGWSFPTTGLDALDSTGPFSDGSQQSAAAGSGVSVKPTGIAANATGGFVSATVAANGVTGTVVAQFNPSGTVINSWCSSLPVSSNGCAQPLDVDHPAVAPDGLFSDISDDEQDGVALAGTSGSLSVFTDGTWQTVAAPGFAHGASEVFADPTDGWIAGANTMGLISATPPPSQLASWPVPSRDPLLSVALPPGATTGSSGALAVGVDGTALEYSSGTGWQVAATPVRTHKLSLNGVAFVSASHAVAVGQAGTILDWNGSRWSADPESTKLTIATLNAVAFSSDGQGWAVGSDGTILHYDGTAWSSETIDPADAGTSVTSVAVAGADVFAIANGHLIERAADGIWAQVKASLLPSPAPAVGSLELVSGLPDGGLVIAGKSLLMTRNSATSNFEYAPETFNGIPVALAAFRDSSGAVRAYVSVAAPVEGGSGVSDATGGVPAGDGDLLVQTDSGWNDLSDDTPAATVSSPPFPDGTVHPDPVLAVAASSDGAHAWAVGGYSGTVSADGVGTNEPLSARPSGWLTSSIWRYDAGGSVSSSSSSSATAALPATAGTVSFAYLSSALCASVCSEVQDPQPFVNLEDAATEIAGYAQQPGGPAFTMIGGNAVGSMAASGTSAADIARLPSLLAPLSGVPTYAAYGPLDSVAGLPDPTEPWSQVFADAPAPFGSGPLPSGITPAGAGDPSGSVHKYYALDVSQNGGSVMAIVLDNSKGSLEASAPGQTAWLSNELAQAQAANLPVVVFAAEPLNSLDFGAASDADAVAAQLAAAGVLAVFTTAGGTSADGTNSSQQDQVAQIPADAPDGAPQIPEYEGATMTYQQTNNNGVLWYDASVDTQTDVLTVNAVPVVGSLALEPVDGLTAERSGTLQFDAIGRRSPSTLATTPGDPTFPGFSQYVGIPASCSSSALSTGATCVTPSYTFTSSDPTVGTFVAPSGAGSSYPKLTADGKVTPSKTSGLFCAFNAGTTTVTVTVGLMSSSLPVTVQGGEFGPPCGTVAGGQDSNVIRIQGATEYQTGSSPNGTAPIQPGQVTPTHSAPLPKLAVPQPPVKPVPAKHHAPAPKPGAPPAQPQPFLTPVTPFNAVGVAVVTPVPPPVTPVPPGGATAQAQAQAKREEKARKEASQSAYVVRPAGESASDWFYPAAGGLTLVSLLLIAGGVRPGPKRAPAYARVREATVRRRPHD